MRDGARARARGSTRYEVRLAVDGRAALDHLVEQRVDAVVLDVAMPGLDGLEVCRRLRARRRPHAGADAHRARRGRRPRGRARRGRRRLPRQAVRAARAARRGCARSSAAPSRRRATALRFADLELDPAAREVRRGGRPIELSRTEFALLELFLATRARCSPARRSSSASGATTSAPPPTRSASTSATCGARPRPAGEPRLLHTVRGVGYILREGSRDAPPPAGAHHRGHRGARSSCWPRCLLCR